MRTPNSPTRSALQIAAASALYFALHSLAASFAAKRTFARVFGERGRNGWYRALYSVSAVGGLVALFGFALGKPSREIYHARGIGKWLLHGVQFGGLLMALDAVRQMRVLRLLGASNLAAWARDEFVEAEPEAQGPPPEILEASARGEEPNLQQAGAFALCRNALNFAVLPIFWAYPRLNSNYAAFCAVTTLYCIVGSWLTERRMSARYGKSWKKYRASGVPFLLPRFSKFLSPRDDSSDNPDEFVA